MALHLHNDGQDFWCDICKHITPRKRDNPFPDHRCPPYRLNLAEADDKCLEILAPFYGPWTVPHFRSWKELNAFIAELKEEGKKAWGNEAS